MSATNPHDIAAEQAVLGACLLNTSVIDQVAEILVPGDFCRPIHTLLWGTLIQKVSGGLFVIAKIWAS
jgi:replicative DNA helicase